MDLWQLRYFIAVAEERSITRAAARLHLTQPPLTAQLKRLEAELGVQLLLRHRRGVDLTEAGQAMLERARRMLGELDDAVEAVRGVGMGHAGRLALAFVPAAAWAVLGEILARYVAQMPGVDIAPWEGSPDEVVERVRRGSADAGVFYLPPGGVSAAPVGPELDFAVIQREPLVAVLPSRLAGRVDDRLDLATMRHEAFVLPRRYPRPGLHAHAMAACAVAGYRPEQVIEVDHVHTALALVGAGVGLSLVPDGVRRWAPREVVVAALRQPVAAVEAGIVWSRGASPSPVLGHFLRLALSTPEPDVLGPGKQRRHPTPDA